MGTRERILSSAAQLFSEKGFEATSVREVCEAAGVTKPTLYYYFGSKSGLAEALLGQVAEEVRQILGAAVAERQSLRERLAAVARDIFRRSREEPSLCRFFFASMAAPRGGGPRYDFEVFIPEVTGLTARLFEGGEGNGGPAPGDPHLSAMIFLGVLQAYAMRFVRREDIDLTPELAERVVERLVDGLGPRPAGGEAPC